MSVFGIPDFLNDFGQRRVSLLGLEDKGVLCEEVSGEESFDNIICFDLVELLPALSQHLLDFYKMLSTEGKFILNWYFFKGFIQKFAFAKDDMEFVEVFFPTLHRIFEVFSLYFLSICCYSKWGEV